MQNHWPIDQWSSTAARRVPVPCPFPFRVRTRVCLPKDKPIPIPIPRPSRDETRCRTGASRKRAATATHLIGLWAKSCHSTQLWRTHDSARPTSTRDEARRASLLGLQLIAIELVKELSNFSRLSENGIWIGNANACRKPSNSTTRPSLCASLLPSQFLGFDLARFRLASGWRLRTAFKSGRAWWLKRFLNGRCSRGCRCCRRRLRLPLALLSPTATPQALRARVRWSISALVCALQQQLLIALAACVKRFIMPAN